MPKATASPLTDREREQIERLFGDPTELPAIFRQWLISYIEANPPLLPISQITGFSQFIARNDTKGTTSSESTSSATYVDLATSGPSLTDLSDGIYLIIHGARITAGPSGEQGYQSISVNGGAASDDDSAENENSKAVSTSIAMLKTLSSGQNTIACKYRSNTGGVSVTFRRRWLVALKVANP